ncbi:class I SAM-dependent methyltransferase [Natrinema halophilum]|uniref:Class I SAM-dependent methyltransferase n=1 Tax=Natrinema halophilum TaxID=1699371 RepID=A0A7D5KZR6_9EURY|nr:class I SAM-dependent methyltransferase [Natrinema halophilum]QLG49940.1 class I SAM-dependent methyltransferase [Natrinema halophilum]
MTEPDRYSFRRYLDSKRSVDRRARNRRVADAFRRALERFDEPVELCEVGAGTGAMIETILEWTADTEVRYTAIDTESDIVEAARDGISDRVADRGHDPGRSAGTLFIDRDGAAFEIEFRTDDALAHLTDHAESYDVVVAQAFLDLTDVRAALEAVVNGLRPGGVAYFPITFDGVTSLLPAVDPELEDRIERRFHRRMDTTEKAGGETGDSNAGRHLLTAVPATGSRVVAAGGSDWIVRPNDDGYEADEAYFLHHIVDTIESALEADGAIDAERLRAWAAIRHEQVEAAELVYLAHQLDVLGRWPASAE